MLDRQIKILVTGSRGLVGSAIVKKLIEYGYTNILTPSHKELDFLNNYDVQKYFDKNQPQVVICAAAKVGGIGGNSKDNFRFLFDNLVINQNTIMTSYLSKVKRLVFLGSSCIYPKFATQPIQEKELLSGYLERTNEGYALSKITGIKLCEYIRRQHGNCFYSLMPCNLYGPGDNYDIVNGHVLPTLIRKFIQAKESKLDNVVLWGDGTPLREFLYSLDLADGVVKTLDIEDDNIPDLMNIGSGTEISIYDLAEKIKNIVGYNGTIVWDSSKPNGTMRKIMDSTVFKELTNWNPQIDIDRGIQLCVEDYNKNKEYLRK